MFKNKISITLVVLTCLSMSQFAWAADASNITPERKLLENTIAISGQQLSDAQMSSALTRVLTNYESTSTPEGRDQRFAQAFVDLGVFSDQQASQFQSSLNSAANQYASHQASYGAALATLVAESPKGAEFSESACGSLWLGTGFAGMAVAGGFFATLAAYADLHSSDPMFSTTSDQHWEEGGLITMGVGAAVALVTGVLALNGCQN